MKKKISLFILCGIILLGVCGCGKNYDKFYGSWEITNYVGEDESSFNSNIVINKDYINLDFVLGDNSIFIKNDEILRVIPGSSYPIMCLKLKDENTLKQVKCSNNILDYVEKLHNTDLSDNEIENKDYIFTKVK